MSQDILSDLLRSVRLRGVLFFHIDCSEPWVAEAPQAREIAPAVMPDAEHVMEYHVVNSGTCWGARGGRGAGPPGDRRHRRSFRTATRTCMSSEPGMRAPRTSTCYFDAATGPRYRSCCIATRARSVRARLPMSLRHDSLVCGFLGCDLRPFNPLLAALPR